MSLAEFQLALKQKTTSARQALASGDEICRQMEALGPKLRAFEQLAARIASSIILPRLSALVACFAHANVVRSERPDHCAAVFGYCERFPVSCRIQFDVAHDSAVDQVILHYELDMMPVFHKYEPHDKFTTEVNAVDDEAVADWVEQRLLAFLDDYLRLDRGEPTLDEDLLTDPVCGMRMTRGAAAAQDSYRGHAYYFCSSACRDQFVADPGRFVWFKT